MKYITIILVVVSLISCKRNYTCTCSFDDGTSKAYSIKEKSASNAFSKCQGMAADYANQNNLGGYGCNLNSKTP